MDDSNWSERIRADPPVPWHRPVAPLPPGWKYSPAADGFRSFFYNVNTFEVTQMRPHAYTDTRPNGLPIPPGTILRARAAEPSAAEAAAGIVEEAEEDVFGAPLADAPSCEGAQQQSMEAAIVADAAAYLRATKAAADIVEEDEEDNFVALLAREDAPQLAEEAAKTAAIAAAATNLCTAEAAAEAAGARLTGHKRALKAEEDALLATERDIQQQRMALRVQRDEVQAQRRAVQRRRLEVAEHPYAVAKQEADRAVKAAHAALRRAAE